MEKKTLSSVLAGLPEGSAKTLAGTSSTGGMAAMSPGSILENEVKIRTQASKTEIGKWYRIASMTRVQSSIPAFGIINVSRLYSTGYSSAAHLFAVALCSFDNNDVKKLAGAGNLIDKLRLVYKNSTTAGEMHIDVRASISDNSIRVSGTNLYNLTLQIPAEVPEEAGEGYTVEEYDV